MTDNTDNTTVDETATVPTPKRQRGRPIDPDGGMGRARAFYASLSPEQQLDRKGVVKGLTELQPKPLSLGTARAYCSIIKRAEKAAAESV